MINQDTIAAISTAPGIGAISLIRVSGPLVTTISKQIFSSNLISQTHSLQNPPLLKSHLAQHGYIYDPQTKSLVDEVVITFFKGPNSYTGEDLVEISCHGGLLVTSEILSLLLSQGARLARPGEFTQRAFLADKLDLTQAEAVLDLIQAKTTFQGHRAVSALSGQLGEQIKALRCQLVDLLAAIVAGLDFPEEIGDAPVTQVQEIVKGCLDKLEDLATSARSLKYLQEGLKLAIVGRPNAGKSSLLNQFLKFERAIVTDIPGTTRDSLEEILDLNGIPVTLVDTAGIRKTKDIVEQLGIERSKKAIQESDMVILVVDLLIGWLEIEDEILQLAADKPVIIVGNKFDLVSSNKVEISNSKTGNANYVLANLALCAKTGSGMDILSKAIETWVWQGKQPTGPLLNARQAALCIKAAGALKNVLVTLEQNMPQDCLASDLKIAVDALSEIDGQVVTEEVISNVFANFCIGK